MWRRCFDIENAIDTAAALEEWGDWSDELEEIKELWAYRWIKLHSPVYAVAYVLNPEYHKSKPWEDVEVAADIDAVLLRFFTSASERGEMRAALSRYYCGEGCFASRDENGPRDVWTDEYMTNVSPWQWWKEVAGARESMLSLFAQRVLQVGVSSSVNERAFSNWGHIMGKRRTGMKRARQVKQVNVYMNHRVMKRFKAECYATYD